METDFTYYPFIKNIHMVSWILFLQEVYIIINYYTIYNPLTLDAYNCKKKTDSYNTCMIQHNPPPKSLPYLLKQRLSMQQLGMMHKLQYLQLDDQSVLA